MVHTEASTSRVWWGEIPQPKKRRSKGKNLTLYKKYEQNNKKSLPLAVTTDEDKYRFVGDNSSDFIRLISNEVGKIVPFYYASWQDVPNEYKHAIYSTLFEFFDLQALQDEEYMNQSEWVELIDKLYKSDAYMKRSEKNKANRSKQRYPTYHGSESYSQKRWTGVRNLHGEARTTSIVDGWKKTHYKPGLGWANDLTSQNKQMIQNEARRLGDNSSSKISDEYDVMKHALGERRGHIRGVGRVVKSVPAEMQSSYSSQNQG
ncbi:hypothetical protein R6Q57_012699 [Mikania cordata]